MDRGDRVPDGERYEVRMILVSKGLEGESLEGAVDAITADRRLWVGIMLTEEWGLSTSWTSPGLVDTADRATMPDGGVP